MNDRKPKAGLSPRLMNAKRVPKYLPLPKGEGRGEGERGGNNRLFYFPQKAQFHLFFNA
jgi:hypothetical protein